MRQSIITHPVELVKMLDIKLWCADIHLSSNQSFLLNQLEKTLVVGLLSFGEVRQIKVLCWWRDPRSWFFDKGFPVDSAKERMVFDFFDASFCTKAF